MWRYFVGALAAVLMMGAGLLLFRKGDGGPVAPLIPAMPAGLLAQEPASLPDAPAAANPLSREQKRFRRYDKDRNGAITREEYLTPRRKAYGKLDTNGDGRLSFEEWAVRTTTKFAGADANRSGSLDAREFATTAVKRKTPVKPKCVCPSPAQAGSDDDES